MKLNYDFSGEGASGDLMTDGDIGNNRTKLGAAELERLEGRQLTSIDSSWLSSEPMDSLEGGGKSKKASTSNNWDQFEVNRRLYNVKSTYDENLYTKPLNRDEFTSEQIQKAEKYAREIEGTRSTNIHLQEERGQVLEREIDEEDLYSGVVRQAVPNSAAKGNSRPVNDKSSKNQNTAGPPGINGNSWRRAVTGQNSPTADPAPPGLQQKTSNSIGSSPAAQHAKSLTTTPTTKQVKHIEKVKDNHKSSNSIQESETNAQINSNEQVANTQESTTHVDETKNMDNNQQKPKSPNSSTPLVVVTSDIDKSVDTKQTDKVPATPEPTTIQQKSEPTTTEVTTPSASAPSKLNAFAKEFVYKPKTPTTPVTPVIYSPSAYPNNNQKNYGGNRRVDQPNAPMGYAPEIMPDYYMGQMMPTMVPWSPDVMMYQHALPMPPLGIPHQASLAQPVGAMYHGGYPPVVDQMGPPLYQTGPLGGRGAGRGGYNDMGGGYQNPYGGRGGNRYAQSQPQFPPRGPSITSPATNVLARNRYH